MADFTELGYLERVAAALETLTDVTPADADRREGTKEAKLKRIADSISLYAPDLSDLTSVSGTLTPSAGQVLYFNGTSWVSFTLGSSITVLSDLNDVSSAAPASGNVLAYNATASEWTPGAPAGGETARSLYVEQPDNAEDISYFFTNTAITISELRVVLTGSSSPSVTWVIKHDTNRNATGSTVKSGTTSATGIGDDFTTFTDATIPADSHIWLETTGQSGNVNSMELTVYYS